MNDWEERWRAGRTGWDAGRSAPALLELVQSGTLPVGRALVPGCGAGYDVLTLASPERSVLGLEIAPTAIERFDGLRTSAGVPAERASVSQADFFTFVPGAPFDLVWDYTFLCAINPERRSAWAKQMSTVLRPGGELLTLIFPVTGFEPDASNVGVGPPYPLSPSYVERLVREHFETVSLSKVESSHVERQGKEWLGRFRRRD